MFTNRLAIVTGGGSGIGRAVCQLIAKQNGSVIVADQSVASAQETLSLLTSGPGQHVAVQVDVSQPDSVQSLFAQVRKDYGSDAVATLLANCAGITRDGWMVDMPVDDFTKVMDVNLKGTFLTTQLACKRIIEAGQPSVGGSIVNISSVSARIANLGQVNYVASKCAVEGITRSIAREMGRHNIRCNAVIPGFINTPIINTVPEKVMEGIQKQTPLDRVGQPEEVANVIAFLLSNQSSYVTGGLLHVSGGLGI